MALGESKQRPLLGGNIPQIARPELSLEGHRAALAQAAQAAQGESNPGIALLQKSMAGSNMMSQALDLARPDTVEAIDAKTLQGIVDSADAKSLGAINDAIQKQMQRLGVKDLEAITSRYPDGYAGSSSYNPNQTYNPSTDIARLIVENAQEIGMDPVTYGTILSYETAGSLDPLQLGPVTPKYGQHQGFIQYGEPQAKEYGVDFSSREAALESQLGKGRAVNRYFLKRGWKPGMSDMDAYSIVNAGSPGRYDASDAHVGGAAGTVRDKWHSDQMNQHRIKIRNLLGLG